VYFLLLTGSKKYAIITYNQSKLKGIVIMADTTAKSRKKTDIERAQEYEKKAKNLRAKVRKENEEKRLKTFGKILNVIEEVIDRKLDESDVEKFRNYATGIGKTYIQKALKN
jgi:esterase/lipase